MAGRAVAHCSDRNHGANRKVLKIQALVGNKIVGFSEISEVPTSLCGGLRIDRTLLAALRGGCSFEAMRVDLQ
jgi:hypothetical protein